jgi:predicted MFS family arabinose efflux permease
LVVFGVMQALGLAGYLLVAGGLHDAYLLAAIVYFEQFADGLSTVALFTIMMDRCRAHSPGTDYSLQASLQVLATGIAALCGGVYAERFGYAAVFSTAAAVTLLALVPASISLRTRDANVAEPR